MQKFKILLLTSVSLLFLTISSFAQQQKIETRNGKKYVIHKVQAKETVSAIARNYKVSNKDIIDLNPDVAKVLKVGDLISIPYSDDKSEVAKEVKDVNIKKDYPTYKEAPVTDQEEVKHTVKKGEWLGKIAKQYDVDVAELRKWNAIEADKITPGQELIVGIRTGKFEKKNNENKPNTATNINKDVNRGTDKNLPKYKESNQPETNTVSEIDHIVKEKETLSAIARQYQVKVSDIKAWNDLKSDVVKVDTKLKIKVNSNYMPNPVQPNNQNDNNVANNNNNTFNNNPNNNNTFNNNPNNNNPFNDNSNNNYRSSNNDYENTPQPQSSSIIYTVREGDNIWKLRERFNVSSTEILFWNGKDPNNDRLGVGENLKLYVPTKINHLIQPGETPESIASMHNVNVRQLEIWNKIPEKQLNLPQNFAPGKTLIVYEPTGPTPTKEFKDRRSNHQNNNQPNTNLQANNTNPTTQPTGNFVMHTVGQGESLYDISQKYGITVNDLKEWNGIPNNYYYVQPGNQLRVYVANNQPVNNNNPNNSNWNNNVNNNTPNNNNSNWNNNNNNNPNNTNPRNNQQPNTNTNNNNNNNNVRGNQPVNNNSNNRTNPTNNPYDNPFGNGLYEYKTTSPSDDPFQQLNNSIKDPINNNNNNNNTQPNRGSGNNPNNLQAINPDNPPQTSDYSTNTSRYLDNNNSNTNTNRPTNNGNAVTEVGNASLLTDIPSPRPFTALHRTAPVGTLILVTNAANRKTLVVEVVAPINQMQVPNNVILQVTQAVMNRLGADTNNTIPIEISYMPK